MAGHVSSRECKLERISERRAKNATKEYPVFVDVDMQGRVEQVISLEAPPERQCAISAELGGWLSTTYIQVCTYALNSNALI